MRKTGLLLTLALLIAATACGAKGRDGILQEILSLTDSIGARQWYYKGQYYYRGSVNLKKKNAIVISTPNRRYYMKGGRDLLTEDIGEMVYHSPGLMTRKLRRTYGSTPGYDVSHGYIMEFFNVTLYRPYLLGDHILSPLCRYNVMYYRYSCDSIKGDLVYFSFRKKRRNMHLVDGSFAYDMRNRHISRIAFKGRYNFITFDMSVETGRQGEERYWPTDIRMTFRYWYYGNLFRGRTIYRQQYSTIRRDYALPPGGKDRHDITARYALALDTARAVYDSAYIAEHRPVSLDTDEMRLYACGSRQQEQRQDTTAITTDPVAAHTTPRWIKSLGTIGEFFFNDYDLMTTTYSSLRVLSPNIGFGSKGVSYRQDMEYVHNTAGGRRWSIVPRATYYFRDQEVTGRIRSELLLQPRHNRMIAAEGGMQNITANDNNLFFRKEDEKGNETIESLDFTDYYAYIDASQEVTNGLNVSAGLAAHHRKPRGYARQHAKELQLKSRYRDFTPRMTLTYTPHTDYYRIGDRKVTVPGKWPTFVLNYERGIKGFLGSTSEYEKWEYTISHDIYITPVHRMIWKTGGGMFTNKNSADFVQYEYFNNGITAYNWDDDRSGVFQLLDQKYYNNSYHYLRGHIVIESPMLLLGNFSTHVVRAERLYINALMTEGLAPYLEFGYGLSNELLDISIFASYIKDEALKTGLKFSLHIFD